MFERLGALIHRRRRLVLALWALVVVVGVIAGGRAFDRLQTEFGASDRYESTRVHQLVDELGHSGGEVITVVDGIDVDDPELVADAADAIEAIRELPGVVAVTDPWSTGIDDLRATDGGAALIVTTLAPGLTTSQEHAAVDAVVELSRDIEAPRILVGGAVIVQEEFREAAERDLQRGEMIALPIAFVAMVFILGGFRSALLPIAVAVGAVLATMIVLLAATGVTDVSIFAINVVTMLGLGLGIDYGLLMVSRFREERAAGREVAHAVRETVRTAGVTIVFSALTVAVAMSGLFVFGDPTFTSFGIAGGAVVLLAAVAALTLLPAGLSVWGHRIRPAKPSSGDNGAFARIARLVQRRAGLVVVVVGLGLAVLAVPFLGARFEGGDARSLPRSSEARAAALTLAERFPAHGADPVVVVADATADDPRLVAWVDGLAAAPGVAGVSTRTTTDPGTTIVDVVPAGTSQGSVAKGLVGDLRAAEPGFEILVGGSAGELMDASDMISSRLPWAIGVVVVATFVLLFFMTGSLAVPAKAVVMNVLSLGASFGALVWVFQDGHLSGLLGFDPVGSVDLWMPVLIFIFAFGLSMDYEVFLLSRIKEIHDRTGDNDAAVAQGLQRTGRIITSAALLIVVVFGGFAAGEVLSIKQLGFGMALAVIVDATIVRSLLVPATMRLLGEWNWWAPAPLRRLHERFGLHEPSDEPVGQPAGEPVAVPVPVPAGGRGLAA